MNYQQLLSSIEKLDQHLVGRAVTAVNQALVLRNWAVGAYIVQFEQNGEDRAKYGERLFERLSSDLQSKLGKGFGVRMLQQMANFYRVYPQLGGAITQSLIARLPDLPRFARIPQSVIAESAAASKKRRTPAVAPVSGLSAALLLQLSWTHLIELIRLDDPLKRAFYENQCLKANWSVRQLQRQIGSLLFERTGLSKNKRVLIARAHRQEPPLQILDLIHDPYVLEFVGLAERTSYTESELETALLDHLQAFLIELGVGFCFEARQKRITLGNEHDYIDLVFYHRILRCHVLLDLKVRSFRHGDVGQMNFYVNYYKERVRSKGDNPPVGIILCSDKDQTKVEFATAGLDNKLFVSRYLVALPSTEQLAQFVERDRAVLEASAETVRVSRAQSRKRPSGRRALPLTK
jgi:predicted nuclease of restriction endonuclease-like (RecB) superfamily